MPAAFNEIVGVKPTRGALSTSGVVPACRTIDCVSIFAHTCADAQVIFECARGFDPADPFSRPPGQQKAWPNDGFRFGVPQWELLEYFGDDSAPPLFEAAADRLRSLGGTQATFDFRIFADAARLLYSGPWVAERLAAIRDFASAHPDALHPVTRKIILQAASLTAISAFEAMYQLADLSRAAEAEWARMDFMLLPTAGNCYTHDQVQAEPFALNTNLGYYTNFVNLMDLAAVAVPAGRRDTGMPFGVTLVGPAWSDNALLSLAARFRDEETLNPPYCPADYVPLSVCGAHLSGQPLNYQLKDAGAFLIESCRTSADYRLYALRNTTPAKPGLVRVKEGGSPVEVEVWAVPKNRFGPFVAAVPPPLGIGTCTLLSGRQVKSFICEPSALDDAEEITHLGGWRQYLAVTYSA